jgi:hypothetical protein
LEAFQLRFRIAVLTVRPDFGQVSLGFVSLGFVSFGFVSFGFASVDAARTIRRH